eukprot:g11028.t1
MGKGKKRKQEQEQQQQEQQQQQQQQQQGKGKKRKQEQQQQQQQGKGKKRKQQQQQQQQHQQQDKKLRQDGAVSALVPESALEKVVLGAIQKAIETNTTPPSWILQLALATIQGSANDIRVRQAYALCTATNANVMSNRDGGAGAGATPPSDDKDVAIVHGVRRNQHSFMREILTEVRRMRSELSAAMATSAHRERHAAKRLEVAYQANVEAAAAAGDDIDDDESDESYNSSDDDEVQPQPPQRKISASPQSSGRLQLAGGGASAAPSATNAIATTTETPEQKHWRSEWLKEDRRMHWFISGAPPASHRPSVLQARLGSTVKVSKAVGCALSQMSGFKVMDFAPKEGIIGYPPKVFMERVQIMMRTILTVLELSLPGVENRAEARLCGERLGPLRGQFDEGIALVVKGYKDYPRAFNAKRIRGLVAAAVDKDLCTWSDSVIEAVEDFARATGYEPPADVGALPPLPPLVWKKLASIVRSDVIINAD